MVCTCLCLHVGVCVQMCMLGRQQGKASQVHGTYEEGLEVREMVACHSNYL